MLKQWMTTMAAMAITGGAFAGGPQPTGKVLVVVSSETMLTLKEGALYPTGYYLNELTVPVKRLTEAGYEITFANPNGNPPSLDAHSLSKSYFGDDQAKYDEVKRFHDGLVALRHPRKLADVLSAGLEPYDAIFVPGGHAPMEDLLKNPELGQVLRHFHQQGKPTALICHGPIALLAALPQSAAFVDALAKGDVSAQTALRQGWVYSGYRMTIFSTPEEQFAEGGQLGGKVRFYPDAALRAAAGKVEIAAPWKDQVVRDRELVTGQNPFSDEHLADVLVQMLAERKAR